MPVIHIDKDTPVVKLHRLASEAGLRLKWRADFPGSERGRERAATLRFSAPANDDGDLPPAA